MRHLLFFSLELDITKDMANCNVNPLIEGQKALVDYPTFAKSFP